MAIVLGVPDVDGLGEVVGVLRAWRSEGSSMQLHPGDLGWFWRFGAEATAGAVRTWRRGGDVLAIGLVDNPALLRLAIAPDAEQDEELARRVVDDLSEPDRGALPAADGCVDVPASTRVHDMLDARGWSSGEPWTPLRRELRDRVPDPGLRIEVVGPDAAALRAAVQLASFDRSTFTVERWHAMAAGLPYADARCLVAYDDDGAAVAAVTVWSAGPGRPGLLEPMGVHRDHRGRGHGRAITIAAAAALQEMGSSSAMVYTPSANRAAVATYLAAGFRPLPEIHDLCRPA
ncbi:GNAT family N-acetyltransferase [Actinotalea sp. Marseille-Q4924]|uniref:GNAT family N-acetyltransferase n=1 Tax=Actinotalea sp. Marseille-Q4924 TaxID=2866571 RepID=UPI001CE45067|nr:GNAT family N-acetyltransferase [Actinotalea sp. Marseille-Q4924]